MLYEVITLKKAFEEEFDVTAAAPAAVVAAAPSLCRSKTNSG